MPSFIQKFFRRGKKILLVEDDLALSVAMYDTLTREGYRVLEAKDGREGLSKAIKQQPDLILLDLMLPGLDGIGFLKELRIDEWGARAKVIILTALLEGNELMVEAKTYGVTDFIEKSNISLSALRKRIEETLT